MAGISFIGSYSGIDKSTIDQLMEAERMPLKQLTNKQFDITEKKDAWKDVNTRLNSLYEKMDALKKPSSFNSKLARSSNDKYVTMDVGNSATEGKYDIHVERLATNTSLVGKKVENVFSDQGKANELNKEGSFTITNGDKGDVAVTRKIDVEVSDTLRSIVEKINLASKDSKTEKDEKGKFLKGSGISATIVDNRIVLRDEKTGNRDISLKNVENTDGENKLILKEIGLDIMGDNNETGIGADSSWGKQNGSDAVFTLNGIQITRNENKITDAIDGIVINLNKAHDSGQTDTVSVSSDTEKAAKVVQDFVDQYNSTMKFIEEKTAAGDPKIVGSKGSLAGESSLIRLQSTLRKFVTDELGEKGDNVRTASQIGVSTFDKSGSLVFDKEKFLTELNKDKDGVMKFLNPAEGKMGLVSRVNDYIDGFISKSNGIIKDKNESFEKSLKDLSNRIENFEERMVKKEAYYIKTFTALDVAMMKAEDQMGWLQGQVDSMNGMKR